MIYLDHNATTPLDPRVREAMEPYLGERFGNPSSVHGVGRAARRAIEEARERVARFLGAREAEEIVFTSGGTESDAQAILGIPGIMERGIAVTSVEHPAVREAALTLAGSGARTEEIPVRPSGELDLDAAHRAIARGPALLSVMAANNEYGGIFPVPLLAREAHEMGVIVHSDAVAAAGSVAIDVGTWEIDLLSISAHKIYGPKGVGALYVRKGLELRPLIPGGGQERRRRGGTENVAGIVGFGEATRLLAEGEREENARVAGLRAEFEELLRQAVPGIRIWGEGIQRVAGTSAVSFPGRSGEALLIRLDLAGIEVSTGSACSSGSLSPAPAILALGATRQEAKGTVRFSFGRSNRREDLPEVIRALEP